MKNLTTKLLAILMMGFFAWGCEDQAVDPVQANNVAPLEQVAKANKKDKPTGDLLKNIAVTAENFSGTLSITEFAYDEVEGLLASGQIVGTYTDALGVTTQITQSFSNIPATLAQGGVSAQSSHNDGCQILFLELGPIFLDLLGLQIDLSQIVLDITAVPGAGNLLGNLLCAVAGLLDPGSGLLNFIEDLTNLLELLNTINNIL